MQLIINSINLENKTNLEFDNLLETNWLNAENKNVIKFRFKDCVRKKILDGNYLFNCYLNVNRLTMKRKAQEMNSIKVEINKNEFNFTKIKDDEKLFDFKLENIPNTIIKQNYILGTIIVNNAPIEHCSSLLVLELNSLLPQIYTKESLLLALYVLSSSKNSNLRLGFNSAGANSSVNHSHWHLYYQSNLLIDKQPIKNNQLIDWFLRSVVFELDIRDQNRRENYLNLAIKMEKLINFITDKLKLAYNLFLTKFSTNTNIIRLFVWPRLPYFGQKDDSILNPALCEFSGFFICKTEQLFNELTENKLIKICKKYEIDQETFNQILLFIDNEI